MGRIYFITGASSGFGQALAEAVLKRGDSAILTARRSDALSVLVRKYPSRALAVAMDVTSREQRDAAVKAALGRFSHVDVLVNAAGNGSLGAMEEFSSAQIRSQMEVNFFGGVELTLALLPSMREQRRGHIVNFSSVGGVVSMGGFSLYCASKFAVEGFSEGLRHEVKPLGIHVTIIEPGAFRTEFSGAANMRPENSIDDYKPVVEPIRQYRYGNNGKQPGDPRKAALALIKAVENLVYAVFATATIPHGRTTKIDVAATESAAGVLKVLTHLNTPKLKQIKHPPAGQSLMPLQDDRILYEGQPIALVIADTWERARHAAELVRADYQRAPFLMDFAEHLDKAVSAKGFFKSDSKIGDFDGAFAGAPVRIEQTYRIADRHHNPIESSATIASWKDGKLDMFDATQGVFMARLVIAQALDLKPEDVRIRSKYLGGGYGCKGFVWPHQILAAVAVRAVKRPVKLVLTRAQDYTSHGYQAATEQSVTLAAASDGQLLGLRHESIAPGSISDDYIEYGAIASRTMYACPAIETTHRIVRVHRSVGTPMRAPQEGPSMFGLECAMDELAVELGIDPVELRLKNYAERDPTNGKPFSSKKLRECYLEGARRFGWERRNPKPGSMRDGRDLIGWGMASALMETYRFPATARITLEQAGTVLIESGTQEIGTGVYTIMPQIAADVLGVAAERVRLVLGDTTLPEAGMTAGSSTTMGVGSAVQDAATKLKQKLTDLAGDAITPADYVALLKRKGLEKIAAEGSWKPDAEEGGTGESKEWSIHTFGAIFAEVRVDESLRVPRLGRCVGVYSAGRIINPKTARSQMTGGMIWGLGQALFERTELEHKYGRYVSKDLANYLLPVNADVPALDASFVDEVDKHASPLGAKGIGELGAVGVASAIANAVFHATGKRVRDLPITIDKLI